MAKKIFLTAMVALLFILALTTVGFAKSSNTTTKLGNEVTSSMNKTEKDMDDFDKKSGLDEAGRDIENGVRDTGDTIKDGVEDMGEGMEDLVDGEDDSNIRTENKAVAGTTGNYSTSEVQTGATENTRNGMTQNAWIWIVMVIVALIIIAAVWYYATQK